MEKTAYVVYYYLDKYDDGTPVIEDYIAIYINEEDFIKEKRAVYTLYFNEIEDIRTYYTIEWLYKTIYEYQLRGYKIKFVYRRQ